LSISGIKEKLRGAFFKTAIVCLILSAAAILVDNIYALFGHGVRSAAMTYMFLYPLIGGTVFYSALNLLIGNPGEKPVYRVFKNLWNSGLAVLTVGSLLKGILEIAGAESPYVLPFQLCGWMFLAAGLALLLVKRK
jgi:hypothetical protein